MLYHLLRYWCLWGAKYFFSKTYFTGMDKLPDDKPIMLAVNHPTAFMEQMYMGGATIKAQNFMLRGDMFSGGEMVYRILRSLKCIPIYRARDGMTNLKKNEDILNYCYSLLGNGKNIYINSEGESKHEKRLRPIQKGTARMAFGAYEKYKREDILIIPVGINYAASNTFRSKVYADFGTPIPIADFFEDYDINPRRAIKRLTDRLTTELRKRVIHVEKEADDEVADQLLIIMENNYRHSALPLLSTKTSPLFKFIELINKLNALEESQKDILKEKSKIYFSALVDLNIRDIGICQTQYFSGFTSIALILGFVPALIGLLGNIIPIYFIKLFVDKKIEQEKFYSSMLVALGTVFYPIYLAILLAIAFFMTNLWGIFTVLLLPLFGHFSVVWLDYARKWNEARKAKGLKPEELIKLQKERLDLLKF